MLRVHLSTLKGYCATRLINLTFLTQKSVATNSFIPVSLKRMASIGAKRILEPLGSLDINGKYRNELGSIMKIDSKENGFLKGVYKSGVGTVYTYPLTGSYDRDGQALGWVVSYQKANSTCAWSGQIFENSNGKVCIHTTWLLTSQTAVGDIWGSTNVGVDVFTRISSEDDPVEACTAPKHCNIPAHVLKSEKQ
ncbi:Tamavidin 2 [Oopsacas minuta]|uniref:Tamavidin 2 n=1 Tax=Oopsacas minuta TaxID=111878 RepID=A0AAV7JMU2_9METZ|nr:Tamavidin 2 [Oopsacas minuta]